MRRAPLMPLSRQATGRAVAPWSSAAKTANMAGFVGQARERYGALAIADSTSSGKDRSLSTMPARLLLAIIERPLGLGYGQLFRRKASRRSANQGRYGSGACCEQATQGWSGGPGASSHRQRAHERHV